MTIYHDVYLVDVWIILCISTKIKKKNCFMFSFIKLCNKVHSLYIKLDDKKNKVTGLVVLLCYSCNALVCMTCKEVLKLKMNKK